MKWRIVTSVGYLLAVGMSMTSPAVTLVERSPFIPSGFNPTTGSNRTTGSPTSQDGYTFRGLYQLGENYWFLVSDAGSNEGEWVELGKAYEGFEVRRFDPSTKTLTLFGNNTEQQLVLAELQANPKPIPVQGQISPSPRKPSPVKATLRRTIRPPDGPSPQKDSPSQPAPAWLEKLRKQAAERRAKAEQKAGGTDAEPEIKTD